MSLKERPTEYNFGFSFDSSFTCTKRPATTEVSPRFSSFHNDLAKIAYNEKTLILHNEELFFSKKILDRSYKESLFYCPSFIE